jgi:hypothetical protein
MKRQTGVLRRAVVRIALAGAVLTVPAHGQDTAVFIDLGDAVAYPGDTIRIPITLALDSDSLEAYSIAVASSRPDLIVFVDSLIVDTVITCADPPGCTDFDTAYDTVYHNPAFRTGNTLTEEWDVTIGAVLSPNSLKLVAFSNLGADHLPTGIPPPVEGEKLVYMFVHAICDPDTVSGFTVTISVLPTGTFFSDPFGQLILPSAASGGVITILSTTLGDLDHSGEFNVFDVVHAVNCAFKGDCPACTSDLADVDCNGAVNVFDLVELVDHVFRDGPEPACP